MFRLLSGAALGLALSFSAANAARVEFRFFGEPLVRANTSFWPEWEDFTGLEGDPIQVVLRFEVEDYDNINVDFRWSDHWVDYVDYHAGGTLIDAWGTVNRRFMSRGYLEGMFTVSTDENGNHQISGHFLENSNDFNFGTSWVSFGIGDWYRAEGYWQKTPHIPLPASAALLLTGVAALAALRRRRRS